MKMLDNPWVVGLLGLGALVVVISQTFHPRGPKLGPPATRSLPSGVVINTPPTLPGSDHGSAAPAPTRTIEFDYVRSHFLDWISPTQRDPFWQARSSPTPTTNAAAVKVSQLKLKAIWRQDGVSMVAIDKGIYRLGENVEGYKVQRIENNGVWLEYNGHKEMVLFDHPASQVGQESPDAPDAAKAPPATLSNQN